MKSPLFLFPCSPLNKREVDPSFANEYNTVVTLGGEVGLINHDVLIENDEKIHYFPSDLKQRASSFVYLKDSEIPRLAILRSWMLSPGHYSTLQRTLSYKNYNLVNDTEEYTNCHYFPQSYSRIENLTPKAESFSIWNLEYLSNLISEFPPPYILKDYVKSEKHIPGLFKIEEGITAEELDSILKRFREERGKLFNVGFVLKRFVDLKKYEDKTNEWRIFVFEKNILSIGQNSNLESAEKPNLDFLKDVIQNVKSNFYTIDIAETKQGSWIIIEVGDGQVSGLSSSKKEMTQFYNNLISLGGA